MKRIKIVPYGCVLHITNSFLEWNKRHKKLTGRDFEEGSAGLTLDARNGNYYVGVFDNTIGTLAHELGHVCLDVSRRVSLGDIAEEQEQFCYLLGYLTDESIKVLAKLGGTSYVRTIS